MGFLLAFVTIWALVFGEGFFYALLGISLYLILFLVQYRRQEFIVFLITFLIIGTALDFIMTLPFGSHFVFGVIALVLYELLDRFFQGLLNLGVFLNGFIVFTFLGFIRFMLVAILEGGSLVSNFTWLRIERALIFGLVSAIVFGIIKALLEKFSTSKDSRIKIR